RATCGRSLAASSARGSGGPAGGGRRPRSPGGSSDDRRRSMVERDGLRAAVDERAPRLMPSLRRTALPAAPGECRLVRELKARIVDAPGRLAAAPPPLPAALTLAPAPVPGRLLGGPWRRPHWRALTA